MHSYGEKTFANMIKTVDKGSAWISDEIGTKKVYTDRNDSINLGCKQWWENLVA